MRTNWKKATYLHIDGETVLYTKTVDGVNFSIRVIGDGDGNYEYRLVRDAQYKNGNETKGTWILERDYRVYGDGQSETDITTMLRQYSLAMEGRFGLINRENVELQRIANTQI